jgi:ketosteroid isomerase-like protein
MNQAGQGSAAAVERLLLAMNAHNLDAMVACFADDYVNEWPAHPQRGFRGSQQVRRNWSQIIAGVPNLRARLPRMTVDGDTVWTEWDISGTRNDGAAFLMRAWPSSASPRAAWPGCGTARSRSRRRGDANTFSGRVAGTAGTDTTGARDPVTGAWGRGWPQIFSS